MDDAATSTSVGSPTSASKRKGDDQAPGPPQHRAKRNRYISIACNECKRRKIKCNGQTPCQRCGNLSLECLYTPNCCGNNFRDSEDFKQMNAHIASLQQQVELLFANLHELRSVVGSQPSSVDGQYYPNSHPGSVSQASMHPGSPSHSRTKSVPKPPRFQGPTSSAFSLGVAKSSLQTMGITGLGDGSEEGIVTRSGSPTASPGQNNKTLHPDKDPIYFVNRAEAFRLCDVYEEEMGLMYPVVNLEHVKRHANLLYNFTEAATKAGMIHVELAGSDAISDEKTNILKMVLALALISEGSGQSMLGQRLYESVQKPMESLLLGTVDIVGLRLITLCAMYHFQRDDESLAWRIIGHAGRLCMELGLHRREAYEKLFPDPSEQGSAVRLFWAIYVLDRRWSFGTGMPFVLQDTDIDPNLDKPGDSSPYLMAMIAYSGIGSKVWRSVSNVDNTRQGVNREEIGYLDYQTIQWHRSIPDSLRYIHPGTGQEPIGISRGVQRLRILLYLRANQMRILIYRPVLHSATSIMDNREQARTVVDIAKDTIHVLTHVNQTSDIYRTQQVCFNYFLISALAVVFLAVSHAPAQFSAHCRDEFYMALDLVRGFSATSYVSKRLWRTIRELKQVGPKLGLMLRQPPVDGADAHSTAAVAMAGLAGHPVDEMAIYAANGGNNLVNSPNGMANDLTNLFEAAGGYANLMASAGPPTSLNGYAPSQNGENGVTAFGNDDELSRIMKDLF
ncbi:MAG: hypothetical protein M1820_000609 [Bogoriella megaspora]|nr:MAG: hypothetical protein M1820_000609 [Bogoriella megaspora]